MGMATDDQQPPEPDGLQPQPFLLTGFGLLGAAFVWNGLAPAALPELRSAAIALGLLVIGFILWRLVPRLLEQEGTHWAAAGLWGLGAVACVVACHGLGQDWDSLALLYA